MKGNGVFQELGKIEAKASIKGLALSQSRPPPFLTWSHHNPPTLLLPSLQTPPPCVLHSPTRTLSYGTQPPPLTLSCPSLLSSYSSYSIQLSGQYLNGAFHNLHKFSFSYLLHFLLMKSIYHSLFGLCVCVYMQNYLINVYLPHIAGSNFRLQGCHTFSKHCPQPGDNNQNRTCPSSGSSY